MQDQGVGLNTPVTSVNTLEMIQTTNAKFFGTSHYSQEPSMNSSRFSNPDIIQSGQALAAAGPAAHDPASELKTGNGNPASLARAGEDHLGGQPAAPVQSSSGGLPIEVTKELIGIAQALSARIDKLAVTLNDTAIKAAEQRVDQIQRSADEQSGKDKAVLADASVLFEEQQARLTLADAAVDDLTRQLADSQALVQEQNVELGVASDFLGHLLRTEDESGEGYRKETAIQPGIQNLH